MNRTSTYKHTQTGTVVLVTLGIMAVVFAVVAATVCRPLLITVSLLLLVAWLFYSLTIEIAEGELRWRFGAGLIRKRIALDEIVSAQVVRTMVLEGWGIHYSRFGWLYNVSGFGAVAITLRNGKRFCLGTDEPEILAARLAKT